MEHLRNCVRTAQLVIARILEIFPKKHADHQHSHIGLPNARADISFRWGGATIDRICREKKIDRSDGMYPSSMGIPG